MIHYGCVKYLKGIVTVDSEKIVCCDNLTDSASVVDSECDSLFLEAMGDISGPDKKVDIKIFNYIVKQKDTLIQELRDKIDILNKHIGLLEHIKTASPSASSTEQKRDVITASKKSSKSSGRDSGKHEEIPMKESLTHGIPNNNIRMDFQSTKVDEIVSREKTKINLHGKISSTNGIESNPAVSQPNQENEWVQVTGNKKKNRRQRTVVVGNNSSMDVKGVPKHVTLHVYRLQKDTTSDSLSTLLKQHFPEVVCEGLTSRYPELYASFKVSIFASNFRTAMDPEVWPEGACVSRFFDLARKSQTKT